MNSGNCVPNCVIAGVAAATTKTGSSAAIGSFDESSLISMDRYVSISDRSGNIVSSPLNRSANLSSCDTLTVVAIRFVAETNDRRLCGTFGPRFNRSRTLRTVFVEQTVSESIKSRRIFGRFFRFLKMRASRICGGERTGDCSKIAGIAVLFVDLTNLSFDICRFVVGLSW